MAMDAPAWNERIAHLPGVHLLQSWQWGQVKAEHGWQPLPFTWDGGAALVLERSVRFLPGLALRMLYVPRGPLLDWGNSENRADILSELEKLARQRRAIFIKIDPEVCLGTGVPGAEDEVPDPTGASTQTELQQRGWHYSPSQVQFRNTVMIDLTASEENMLARMKQKTRYNIRLAERKGVTIREGDETDLPLMYRMYAETSVRDGFVIRPESYYLHVWQTFMRAGMARPLLAEVEGEAVAGIMLFHFAGKAWYLYGMSREAHREKMPNYLLQWQAMRIAKQAGCTLYDLWGAPDEFNDQDSMWGVFRFKEGLGGQVVRTIGAWDFPAQPLMYTLYTRVLPRLLDLMRRRGKERTRQEVTV